MSQKLRLKHIDETRNYFSWRNIAKWIGKEKSQLKVCTTQILFKKFLILASAITGGISVSAFASFLGIPIAITSSAIGLKILQKQQESKNISQ